MGMYDFVKIENFNILPLDHKDKAKISKEAGANVFQTKSFDCEMDGYVIKENGDIIFHKNSRSDVSHLPVKIEIDKTIYFCTSVGDINNHSKNSDYEFFDFKAEYNNGSLVKITRIKNT